METLEKDRVRRNTSEKRNNIIDTKTVEKIRSYAEKSPEEIQQRLKKLDSEWDIERILELNASTIILMGVLLSIKDKRWLILSGLVSAFLLQHAIQGWCPPLPVLRGIGFRTKAEIDREKYALKVLNGDIKQSDDANEIWQMIK